MEYLIVFSVAAMMIGMSGSSAAACETHNAQNTAHTLNSSV